MTAELSARLRQTQMLSVLICLGDMNAVVDLRNCALEAADALDAKDRELTGAREEAAHHIRLNADLRLNNADLQGHANRLAARIAELERALPKLEWRQQDVSCEHLYAGQIHLGTISEWHSGWHARDIDDDEIIVTSLLHGLI